MTLNILSHLRLILIYRSLPLGLFHLLEKEKLDLFLGFVNKYNLLLMLVIYIELFRVI